MKKINNNKMSNKININKIVINTFETDGHIQPELHSQFIEFLGSCIYDGIWVGEDSHIPNYHGIRKDVADALKELEPPVIRWPGGCYADTYHWRDGIGERSKRPVTYNENFGTFELDSNQFGTHEFMELCKYVGAKPWLNINLMNGSVAEMKEWMEYCNRKEKTTLALERKENGSEEPFQVEYWGIGNEMWAGGGNATPQSYAAEYRKYATAFPVFSKGQGKNPIQMKRIACGPDGNNKEERVEWTKQFFESMAEFRQPPLDGYDIHFYNWNLKDLTQQETDFLEAEWYEVINGCLELEEVIREQEKLVLDGISDYPESEGFFKTLKPQVDLIIGEWGNWHGASFAHRPALYQQCTMRDAVTSALTLDIFHRNCKAVKMACVAQTVNVLNSLILTDGHQCVRTPNYDVFQMYKVHRGGEALNFNTKVKPDKLFLFASVKKDVVSVNIVNTEWQKEQEVFLEFPEDCKYVGGQTLKGDSPQACNTFDDPDRVRAQEAEMPVETTDGFKIQIPAASVNVYQFQIVKG